jgi:polysaccharide export outer membrane protein
MQCSSFLVAILVLTSWLSGRPVLTAEASYLLNPGDLVRVSVWREEELNRQALVQPDGSLSFPLVGQISAAGRTPSEVQEDIKRRMDYYIPDAVVTVELVEARGNKVFVIGEVNRPGEYQLGRPITVVQAISLAGGFTPFARRSKIRVLRASQPQEVMLTFDYDDVAEGTRLDTNLQLKAGDTVIVPGGSLF